MKSLYGLIGYPLGHSCSPKYFNNKFEKENIDAEYKNFEIKDIQEIKDILTGYPNLKGFNVTIPHKQNIIPLLNELSDEATKIGAVNCVKIYRRGRDLFMKGYNTDVIGFKNSLIKFIPNYIEQALILGNGGAAKAIRYALDSLGIKSFTVSRTPKNNNEISYSEVSTYIPYTFLIVNTTPLGTWPKTEACPDIPYHLLTSKHYLYDLIYNPEITTFMKKGAEAGAHTKNGQEMWLGQAEKNWEIWTKP